MQRNIYWEREYYLPEHLNDEPLGRVLDKLYDAGLTEIFIRVPLSAADRFGVKMDSFHLDSS
ncbi:MAG: DUF4277 domain-containing protein [Richelia sp.]|nr:DUF4277 domain-containing protein [Richelia sp.]CDN14671.1 hypothetical protein RintRC_2419 [Richelia intracellularis]